MGRKTRWLSFGAVILLALILRAVVTWFAVSEPSRLGRPDTPGYMDPARALAEHGEYPTTRRPPGLPVLAAAVFSCGGGETELSWILMCFGAATTAVVMYAGRVYGGDRSALTAGVLYALHPTAIGNAPLLLTDTLGGFFTALQFLFFLLYWKRKKYWACCAASACAGIGALIRPINVLWIIPLVVLIIFSSGMKLKVKAKYALISTFIFCALIFPWMFRNIKCGAGFCIDTNTGAMYHQNGAMLAAEVYGTGYEYEKARILSEQEIEFSDLSRYPDEKSREEYRIKKYRELVCRHFGIWLKQQFDWRVLLPDAPAVLEAFGVTSSDRGTMDVMKRQGVMAAVRHYFGENWLWWLLLLSPLLMAALLTAAASFLEVAGALVNIGKCWFEFFVFLAFVEYYFFLPGAVTVPRYQLPALPCMCVFAAIIFARFIKHDGNVNTAS